MFYINILYHCRVLIQKMKSFDYKNNHLIMDDFVKGICFITGQNYDNTMHFNTRPCPTKSVLDRGNKGLWISGRV